MKVRKKEFEMKTKMHLVFDQPVLLSNVTGFFQRSISIGIINFQVKNKLTLKYHCQKKFKMQILHTYIKIVKLTWLMQIFRKLSIEIC